MAKIKSWFDCDLQKAVQIQALNGNVFSMDNNGNQICVRIFDGGEKAVISATVTARCILADGSTVTLNGSLTSVNSQSVAVVDIPQSVLLIPGTLKISVQLTASSVVATIAAIITTVYATKTDNVITPSSQVISDWNAEISSQLASAVKFSSQSLTDAQKTQARSNIGAVSTAEMNTALALKVNVSDIENDLTGTTAGKVLDARQGKVLDDKVSELKSALSASNRITANVANIIKINLLDRNGELDNYYWYYDGVHDLSRLYNSGAGTYLIVSPVRLLKGITYTFNGFYGTYSFICNAGTRTYVSNLQGVTSYTPDEDVDLFITIKKNTASSAYVYATFNQNEFNVDKTLSISKMPADAKTVGGKFETVALDVNGKEPEYKYGYLQKSNGAISPASSGNNKYFVVYPLGNETYLFSGAYSDTTWPLVFGYDSAGNSSVLVTGGSKTNYKFTVPDGIVEIRGWSDTSRVDLKIVPFAIAKDTQEELDDLEFYIRPNLVQQIGYLGSDNGAIYSQSSGSNRYYQVKGLHGGERFIYSGGYQPGNTGWGLAFSFDAQGNVTKLFGGAKTGYEFTTPNDCVELRAWGDTSNYALSLVYADAVDSRLDMLEGSSIPRMIVVDAGGDGEFTDIQSAIDFAKANYSVSSKPVIIYVMNGIYAVSPKAESPYYAIDKGGNKISIIGESRDGVIIRCTCTSELQGIALNIGGECTIENLTIENLADETYTSETILEGNHRPYCLHNDSDGEDESKKYYTTVRNCKFYSECDTPIGAGMHTNQIQRYENVECVYAEDAVIKQQGAFYLHGPYSSGFNPIGAEIVDCVFISNNSRPAISMQNVSGTKPWAEMSQTFIRNVTYSAGSSEVSLATTSSITPQSKGNTNNTLNKQ